MGKMIMVNEPHLHHIFIQSKTLFEKTKKRLKKVNNF